MCKREKKDKDVSLQAQTFPYCGVMKMFVEEKQKTRKSINISEMNKQMKNAGPNLRSAVN
jgi:hypothetical protein